MKLVWKRGRKSDILLLSNSLAFAWAPIVNLTSTTPCSTIPRMSVQFGYEKFSLLFFLYKKRIIEGIGLIASRMFTSHKDINPAEVTTALYPAHGCWPTGTGPIIRNFENKKL